jgi:hypothetical protein
VCTLHLDHYLEAGVYVHADKLPVESACKIMCTRLTVGGHTLLLDPVSCRSL